MSFEAVARQSKAKFVLGLSATVTRKDGHHPLVFMQCGPVRHRVDARKQAAVRPFAHKVVFRSTAFAAAQPATAGPARIQELYGLMAKDAARNDLIFDDVLLALEAGRSPVILTERKDHLLYFANRLSKFAKNVIVFHGGMKAKAQKESERALKEVPDSEERVLLATVRPLFLTACLTAKTPRQALTSLDGKNGPETRLSRMRRRANGSSTCCRLLSRSIPLQRSVSTVCLTVSARCDARNARQNKRLSGSEMIEWE